MVRVSGALPASGLGSALGAASSVLGFSPTQPSSSGAAGLLGALEGSDAAVASGVELGLGSAGGGVLPPQAPASKANIQVMAESEGATRMAPNTSRSRSRLRAFRRARKKPLA